MADRYSEPVLHGLSVLSLRDPIRSVSAARPHVRPLTPSETNAFGGLQTLQSWLADFGEPVAAKPGTYALPTDRQSIMTSVVWTGKLVGSLGAEPLVQRWGFKWMTVGMVVSQVVGVVRESLCKPPPPPPLPPPPNEPCSFLPFAPKDTPA